MMVRVINEDLEGLTSVVGVRYTLQIIMVSGKGRCLVAGETIAKNTTI